jgi:hypothetical protein
MGSSRRVVLCLLLVSAACGKDKPGLPDAPGADADPGAADAGVDAAPSTARIRVTQERWDTDPGTPIEGVEIGVVGQATIHLTDALGVAEFPVEAGSTIIAVREAEPLPEAQLLPGGGGGQGWVYIVGGVGPGSVVELGGLPYPPDTGTQLGTLTVIYPLYTGGGSGATYNYWVDGMPCAFEQTAMPGQVVFEIYEYGCLAELRSLQIVANDGKADVAYLAVPNVPNNMAGDNVIDNTTATWETGMSYDIDVSNTGDGYFAETYFATATDWRVTFVNASLTAGAGTGATTDGTRSGAATAQTFVYADSGRQYLGEPTTLGTTYAIDGTNLLPYVTGSSYDPGPRRFDWTTTSTGIAPDAVITSFGDYDEINFASYEWLVYMPGDTTSFVIPDIHDTITDYDLPINEFVYGDIFLVAVDGAEYQDLLADIDHYNYPDDPQGYRPTQRVNVSGASGGKGLLRRRAAKQLPQVPRLKQ